MKIAITGTESILGKELIKRGAVGIYANLLKPSELSVVIEDIDPDVIIHNFETSNVGVDYCEDHQERAYQEMCNGTNNLLNDIDGFIDRIVYISSDHVFSGNNFFSYREHHDPNPVNWYGFCKMVSEKLMGMLAVTKHSVVRTSTLFDSEYFQADKEKLLAGKEIYKSKVIRRSYMYVSDFANALMSLINMVDMPSLIHIAGTLTISEYDFFRYYAISNLLPTDLIIPVEKWDETMIPRPKRGGLNVNKAEKLGIPLKSYVEGIDRMIEYGE